MSEVLKRMASLSPTERETVYKNLHKLPPKMQEEFADALATLSDREALNNCRSSLLDFVMRVDKTYKIGLHHRKLASLLEDMALGRKDRCTVSMPPRFGKSQLTSVYFPAWYIGNFPDRQIMMVTHTADLSVDFGRKVRNLVDSEEFKKIFPDVSLAADSKSAGRWNTSNGGVYYATGIGGAIAGRGADFLCIDDAVNEQDILNGNYDVLDKAYDWYAYGARTRLMPNGCVAIVGTRWAQNDLIGRVIQDMVRNPEADQWEVVEFPAIFEKEVEVANEDGVAETKIEPVSLWPEQWSIESLLRTKASMPPFQWNAQYMQHPTSAEAAIIKREWWRPWEEDNPPYCEYVIMSLDAAAEKNNRADFTALTTWGVFTAPNEKGDPISNIILLNSIKERWEFPTLKRRAYEEYKEWNPDWFVVEKKSAGVQLYQEMRSSGVPVQEFTPHRGSGDKTARLNSVSDIFASGLVWYPAGRRWAEEVVDEVCGFPAMAHDDIVDATVMALMRFRNGGFIKLPSDRWDEQETFRPVKAKYY
jgi:predicted phage terminase large subunit-like protein